MYSKVKVKCKGTMSVGSRHYILSLVDIYIKDKWYDAEFEYYPNEEINRINGGYRKVWVYDETGNRRQVNKGEYGAVFYKTEDLRDNQINNIIDES